MREPILDTAYLATLYSESAPVSSRKPAVPHSASLADHLQDRRAELAVKADEAANEGQNSISFRLSHDWLEDMPLTRVPELIRDELFGPGSFMTCEVQLRYDSGILGLFGGGWVVTASWAVSPHK